MRVTKKLMTELTQSMIDMHRVGEEFYPEVMEFFNVTVGRDFVSAKRVLNPLYPTDKRHIHVNDGQSWESFSWRKAINGKDELGAALRYAIKTDIDDYRSACSPQSCAKCASTQDPTVDHKDIPFKKIREAFLLDHPDIELMDGPDGGPKMIKDMNIEAQWITFHAANATYQILCRSCNSAKGAK